ncbi:hypothetical protein F6A13_11130 [Acidithiobacillus sp. 'AMD consortium']|jgi:hypothetical protein|uniref:Uncharacterized protein n=2 Tax=Acidithiobacillus ferrooxidans TaxID=920 RepID=B7J732_ACIF2|nr:hypothetical protein Lferr_2121 [Acidithiobacillus ferrooxidans ATCC 53993]ACK80537.1 hypothetical protein AFE_2497 [Acidithiobacillus ferrooxidans ATCC 23270]EGQ61323.1 hypothetical protein GGI1_05910 [Acidithiobacillus sp. GGI-221]MBU2773538.1 hypothetical protein [Acidithiobacillus ferrooxidans]MBU2808507.1 hypothetical protein [Acidithiobacillus ferrooxidans F221]QFG79106.1 hypothetical protein F6A13_11130 [Acidithiobacillus sp. 'AMD consortium']
MKSFTRHAQTEGISPGTLAGRLLAEAVLALPPRQGLSSGEIITLHAAIGLDKGDRPRFTVTLLRAYRVSSHRYLYMVYHCFHEHCSWYAACRFRRQPDKHALLH